MYAIPKEIQDTAHVMCDVCLQMHFRTKTEIIVGPIFDNKIKPNYQQSTEIKLSYLLLWGWGVI